MGSPQALASQRGEPRSIRRNLRVHEPHPRRGDPPGCSRREGPRLIDQAHEAAGLGQTPGRGLAEPSGEGERLVPRRAAVAGDERAEAEHDATEEARPEQHLSAPARAVEVGPERERGERLPKGAELGGDRPEFPAQGLVDEALALLGGPPGQRLHRGVGERVTRAEERSHPVDPGTEPAAGLLEVDEAGGEHDVGFPGE